MTKEKALKVAKQYFDNHKVDEFHVTSDEQVFFNAVDAENHATSFNNEERVVITVKRSDYAGSKKSGENGDNDATKKAQELEKLKADLDEAKKIFEAETDEEVKKKIATTAAALEKEIEKLSK